MGVGVDGVLLERESEKRRSASREGVRVKKECE